MFSSFGSKYCFLLLLGKGLWLLSAGELGLLYFSRIVEESFVKSPGVEKRCSGLGFEVSFSELYGRMSFLL